MADSEAKREFTSIKAIKDIRDSYKQPIVRDVFNAFVSLSSKYARERVRVKYPNKSDFDLNLVIDKDPEYKRIFARRVEEAHTFCDSIALAFETSATSMSQLELNLKNIATAYNALAAREQAIADGESKYKSLDAREQALYAREERCKNLDEREKALATREKDYADHKVTLNTGFQQVEEKEKEFHDLEHKLHEQTNKAITDNRKAADEIARNVIREAVAYRERLAEQYCVTIKQFIDTFYDLKLEAKMKELLAKNEEANQAAEKQLDALLDNGLLEELPKLEQGNA